MREWSKAEIARIREETDARIVARKSALDGEMDAFAAVIEARVERVNKTVAEFEAEMAEFFERLLAEQDPTRIATMAQAMPDPPDLAAIAATVTEAAPRVVPTADPVEPDAEPATQDDVEAPAAEAPAETETQTATEAQAESEPVFEAQAESERRRGRRTGRGRRGRARAGRHARSRLRRRRGRSRLVQRRPRR